MLNFPLLYKVLRDLRLRIGTLIAVTCVLAVGVSSYIGMASVYQDLRQATDKYYTQYHLTDFVIDLKRAPETVTTQLKSLPNIKWLRTRIKTLAMVTLPIKSYQNFTYPIPGEIFSLPVPRQDNINDILLYKGRWFSAPYAKEIILNEQFAKTRHLAPGDRIKVRLPDKEHKVLVVGTAYSPEHVLLLPPGAVFAADPGGFAAGYMPRKFLQERSGLKSSFNQLLGITYAKSNTALQNTMTLLSKHLLSYGPQLQTTRSNMLSVKSIDDELKGVKSISRLFPSMFLLVAALVLNVMLSRLVTQQRIQIGTLKALGYGNFAIIRHFLSYGLVIGILGGIFGAALGIFIQYNMLAMYKMYFVIPNMSLGVYPKILGIGLFISVVSAGIGALFGSVKAMRLTPAEAMRPQAPEKFVRLWLERVPAIWRRLPFQAKMILRTVFRSKLRSLVTILASVLATALVFSSLSFLDAMDKMISYTYEFTQHQDYTLTLRDPLGADILQAMENLPGVAQIETQLKVPAKLSFGPFMRHLTIIGLPQKHQLYTPLDDKGKPIPIEPSGLVFTKTLAKILHVKIGDQVLFKPLLGRRETKKVMVSNIIPSYLGFSAYTNQTWLSHLLGDSWVTTDILFKLKKNANIKLFISKINKFAPMINLTNRQRSKRLLIQTMNQFMTFSMFLMIGIAAIIAIGSIVNTAMISLNERERDVATLRVIGYGKRQVWLMFLGESGLLNCLGIIFGLGLGIYFAYGMSIAYSTEMFRIPMVIKVSRLFQAAMIMLGFILISQLIIYRIIKKMNWFLVLNARE